MTAMLRLAAAAGLAGLSTVLAPARAEDEACHLTRVAHVDMSIDGSGRIGVPMQIAGKTVNMMIDTGGVNSLLTPAVVQDLGLEAEPIGPQLRITNFGGYRIDKYATAHDVDFGGLKAHSMPFLVSPPELGLGPEIQGILGPEVLRAYDDDFDFANGTFSLFQQNRCDGSPVYWTSDASAEIPFNQDQVGHIKIDVMLDGKEVHAVVDTGAYRSIMDLEAAEDLFGFKPGDPGLTPLRRTANGYTYRYPFKALAFGDRGNVTVSNPDIVLMSRDDSRTTSGPRMLVGMGVLRQLHIYLSYRHDTMYVTAASAH